MFDSPILEKALWYSKRKVICKIVYRVSEKKIADTTGIIRDILVKDNTDWLILENGLPIALEAVLSINSVE